MCGMSCLKVNKPCNLAGSDILHFAFPHCSSWNAVLAPGGYSDWSKGLKSVGMRQTELRPRWTPLLLVRMLGTWSERGKTRSFCLVT